MIGSTIAQYRILEQLGKGGMGEVYLAEDTRLERKVAIKFLPPQIENDAESLKRFEREAKATAALRHPNIVTVYEIGEYRGRHYIVMTYIKGRPLRDAIAAGDVTIDSALGITRDLCDALGEAHGAGIVHRDLKPENVILDVRGRPHVLDFGLALMDGSTRLTQDGATVGSLHYMSPEQSRGDAVDGRSDIFSLGAILYEMVTGQPAFPGDQAAAILYRIANEDPQPLARYNRDATPELERIVIKALSKDVETRYQTPSDFAADIKSLRGRHSADTSGEQPSSRSLIDVMRGFGAFLLRPAFIGGVVLASIGFLAGIFLVDRTGVESTQPHALRAVIPPPGGGRFDIHPTRPGSVAISPDGEKLVFAVSDRDGQRRLWRRDVDSFDSKPLSGTENATYPFWSPDSRTIAFFADGKLKEIRAEGGPVLNVADTGPANGGTWNENGLILFASGTSPLIFSVPFDGGEVTAVTVLDDSAGESDHCEPRFLPDGKRFLYVARTRRRSYSGGHRLMVGSLSGEAPREIMRTYSQAEFAGGYLWFIRNGTLLACEFDTDAVQITGPVVPVADGAVNSAWAAWNAVGCFSVSAAGVIAYHTGRAVPKSILTWYDREGRELSTVGTPEHQYHISISPDRTRAALQVEDTEKATWGIWIYDLKRGTRSRFTTHPAAAAQPVWSPDGRRIVFGSVRNGTLEPYIKSVTGGEAEALLDTTLEDRGGGKLDADWPLDWSPDGRYIVYCDSDQNNNGDLWGLSLYNDKPPFPIRHSPFSEEDAAISPDGDWLAYISDESGRFEIYVTDFPDGNERSQISLNGGIRPEWSPVGNELFFLDPENTLTAVEVDTGDGGLVIGAITPLFRLPVRYYTSGEPGGYAVGPKAQRFLVNRVPDAGTSSPIRLIFGWPVPAQTP